MCQRPLSTRYWAGWVGRHLGPWPPWEQDAEETRRHICDQRDRTDLAWNGTDWTTASAEGLARRESSVLLGFPFFLLEPHLLLQLFFSNPSL